MAVILAGIFFYFILSKFIASQKPPEERLIKSFQSEMKPMTLPSYSSIMTDIYPLYHGVRDNGGFYLDEMHITLAEALKSQGYSTSAFYS